MVKPCRMIVSSLPDHTAGNTDYLILWSTGVFLCIYNNMGLRFNCDTKSFFCAKKSFQKWVKKKKRICVSFFLPIFGNFSLHKKMILYHNWNAIPCYYIYIEKLLCFTVLNSRCYLPYGLEGRKRSYGMVLPYRLKWEGDSLSFLFTKGKNAYEENQKHLNYYRNNSLCQLHNPLANVRERLCQ